MPHNRFYYPDKMIPKQELILKGPEHHHLFKVMRLSENQRIELIDGKGSLAIGKILHTNKEYSQILIEKCTVENEPNRIFLVQGMMRTQKMDLIIEKATELGISGFIFFPADGSEKKEFSQNQLTRMRQISISATKQSGRLFIPSIEILSSIKEIFHRDKSLYLFGDLSSAAKKLKDLENDLLSPELSIYLIVGPEKGFSTAEDKRLTDHGAIGVSLSQNVLRAETAAIHFTSLITYKTRS